MKFSKVAMACMAVSAWLILEGCNKKEATPVSAPPVQASTPVIAAAPTTSSTPPAVPPSVPQAPAASSDPDSPTTLTSKEMKGKGIKQRLSYYYAFNGGVGTIRVTTVSKNESSGATQALGFGVYDFKANKLCSESSGNTIYDKTVTLNCLVEKAQPLILRLDLSEETIDYSVALEGPVDLPSAQATANAKPIAGTASIDIDEPTRLATNRIKGEGIKKPVAYYYAFNAGPGELTLTLDGKNTSAATADALRGGVYTLRSERVCELSLGNTTLDKRGVTACKFDKRQAVILRLDLSAETIDFRAKFEGPYDFDPFTPPPSVTIALDSAVLFDTGKSALKPEARQALHEAAERVKKFAEAPVTISGHTDNVGNDAANQRLSEKRATAVQEYFVSQEAIGAARLAVKGYGKSQPIGDNKTEDGRARNRRVDVVIATKSR